MHEFGRVGVQIDNRNLVVECAGFSEIHAWIVSQNLRPVTMADGLVAQLDVRARVPDNGVMHLGAKVAGRYAIEEVVSDQGMGSVFKARDPSGNPVAIKWLHPDALGKRERFSREMHTLQDLEHPAIVRYLDSGTNDDGTPYFVMEWLDGEDLASHLRSHPLTLGDTLTWAGRIAEALGVAHARGIVHRDVKPSNIFLPGGNVSLAKLIDFGIAFVSTAETQLTATGAMMGTPAYMAPEQARGERAIDARADIFALGCVIYESMCGVPAFMANTPMAVLGKILTEPCPRLRDMLSDVPERFDQLLERMMAKSLASRPSNGAEVAAELERIWSYLSANEQARLDQSRERPSVLTREELRWVSAVVVAGTPGMLQESSSLTPPTVVLDSGRREPGSMVEFGGAMFEQLGDGSMVNIIEVRGSATDQAASAASLALAFRREFGTRQVAVATGRALMRGGRMAGDVIDRAAAILRDVRRPEPGRTELNPASAIWVDELTAELLDGRFEIYQHYDGIILSGRRRTFEKRTLLGRTTPFVGRRRELAALTATLDDCIEESTAHAVLVTGPAGCGKSRLMHEFLRHLDDRVEDRLRILVGHGDPMHEGSPLFSIADGLRRVLEFNDGASTERRRGALHDLVAQAVGRTATDRVERLVEFIGALLDISTAAPSLGLRAAQQDPRLMGDRIQQAYEDLIAAFSAKQPVVLVIDDLQWSDRATVALLDRMMRNLAESPLLIVAFGRPEIHERFPRIWSARSLTELRLGPLTRRSAEKLATSMLGKRAEKQLVDALVQRAGGNAFYLEELLRHAVAGHSQWPESVLAMVEMRIESLEVQARQTLRAASIFGAVFWRGGVWALLGNDDVDDWLERLVEQELIIESRSSRFASEREYRFRHALVREGAYAMLTEKDRTLGHRLAAEWLEFMGETDPLVVAEQFERGKLPRRALPHVVAAAQEAFERADLEVALELAQRGIRCGADGEQLGRLYSIQGNIWVWKGSHQNAAPLFSRAAALLTRDSRAWYDAAGAAVDSWSRLSAAENVVQIASQLGANIRPLPRLSEVEDDTYTALIGRYIALAKLTQAMFEIGPRDAAVTLLNDIRAAVGLEPDEPLLAAQLHYVGARYSLEVIGDPVRALHHIEAVLVHYDILGDARQACIQRCNLGYVKMRLGLYPEAETELRTALDIAVRLDLEEPLYNAKRLLGVVIPRNHPDKLVDAVHLEREAEAWFLAQRNEASVGWTRVALAGIMYEKGDLDAAAHLAQQARTTSYTQIAATAMLSRIELSRDRVDLALSLAVEATSKHHGPNRSDEDAALVCVAHAEATYASGQRELAFDLIAEAHDDLLLRSAKINKPAWRERFLHHVPDHAHILRLYRAWRPE